LVNEFITVNDRYRGIIDNMLDGFIYLRAVYDDNNNIIDFIHEDINISFEKVIGINKNYVLGKTLSDLFPDAGPDLNRLISTCSKVCSTGNGMKFKEYFDVFNKWLSGSIYTCEYGFVAVIAHDITEEINSEKKLIESEEKSRLLDESIAFESLRTEFFANISHELRTPLNVILGAIQVINLYKNNGNADINQFDKYIKIIKQNCLRLLRLVNNLIDITKIEAGYFEINLENKNIVRIIEDITLSVAEYIEQKSVSLIFDTEVEERIMAIDSDKIERIILNLLSNAVKFTKPGGTILVNLFETDNKFYTSVKDNGIGIPADKLHLVFDRFRQVDNSLTKNIKGSGIGLSIVKSLVELHKGKVTVNSIYGKGTEFIIELPITVIETSSLSNVETNNISNSSVESITIEFSDIYS
jgi:signal transduction histidine kinase